MQRDIKETWKSNIEKRQETSQSKSAILSRAQATRSFYGCSHQPRQQKSLPRSSNYPASDISCSTQKQSCTRFQCDYRHVCRAGNCNHAGSDEKPEEADGDICLSLNPASRTLARLAPARFTQAALGRLSRTGAVAMVTFFSACSLPEPRKTVPLFSTLDGKREREREMDAERETVHLMHTSSKFVLVYAFFLTSSNSHHFLHLSAELWRSLSLPVFLPLSVSLSLPLCLFLSLS